MTRSDVAHWLARNKRITIQDAEVAVAIFFESMAEGLKEGKRVEIRGFGTFSVREYDGYMGRNPRTGEAVTVPPKRLPFFKLAKKMHERINSEESE